MNRSTNNPTVACVMLTANRPEMARHAVQCFRAQTYPEKRLIVYDTGNPWLRDSFEFITGESDFPMLPYSGCGFIGACSIGTLRNHANELAEADIICHFDDDDYSAPNRIAEQVALLQASGAEAVGYNSLLFWWEDVQLTERDVYGEQGDPDQPCDIAWGEAWRYTGGIVGTSLMYWRKTWERRHFEPMNNGEDTRFLMGMDSLGTDSIIRTGWPMHFSWRGGHNSAEDAASHGDIVAYKPQALISAAWADSLPAPEPRMVARIHTGPSGNTSNAYNPEVMRAVERQGGEWKRVVEWDDHCRKVFA